MYFQDIRQSIGFVFVVLMSFGLLCMGNRMLPRKSILSEIEIRHFLVYWEKVVVDNSHAGNFDFWVGLAYMS